MTMPSSEAELDDNCMGGDDNSRGGGDGDDLHDAELLLPGDVPAQDIPEIKFPSLQSFTNKPRKKKIFSLRMILVTET